MGPLQRFLGVAEGADAFRVLALTPGQRHPMAVQRALEAQLARVDRHSDARSHEATLVREALREAARMIREGDVFASSTQQREVPSPTPRTGNSPPPTRQSAVPQTTPAAGHPVRGAGAPAVELPRVEPKPPPFRAATPAPRLELTPFDRHVLAVLIAYGGWNAVSRAHLVASAATHGVTPQGLMKVVTGLTAVAREHGARIDISQVTQGMSRFEDMAPAQTPTIEAPDWADTLTPELRQGGFWATVKLSVLFGAITLLLGVMFVRMLTRPVPSRTGPPLVADGGANVDGPTTGPAPGAGDSPGVEPPHDEPAPAEFRLASWPAPPTFKGDASPRSALDAVDQSPRLPDLFDQLGRQMTVARTPSLAMRQDWSVLKEQAGLCWAMVDVGTLDAVRENVFEVLFAAADRPSIATELIESMATAALRLEDPTDILTGAWAVGMLGAVAGRAEAPSVVREEARRRLAELLPEGDSAAASFSTAARSWLDAQVQRLVGLTSVDPRAYDFWELWLVAQQRLEPGAFLDKSIILAIDGVLRSTVDLSLPGPTANVLGRLLSTANFESSEVVRERTLMMFGDPGLDSRDLWVLGSLLARSPQTRWFSQDLVPSDGATLEDRRQKLQRIERRWPEIRSTGSPDALSPGIGVLVNGPLGERWRKLAMAQIQDLQTLSQPTERLPELLMRRLVLGAWLNEAAAALAAGDDNAAHDVLRRIEIGISASASSMPGLPAGGGGGAPRPPVVPGGPVPFGGGGVQMNPGSTFGVDGEWKTAYEAAMRNTDERMNVLRSLRSIAAGDLGPIDAHMFVQEVYRANVPEVRSFAESLLVELFSRGPNVAVAMLDVFPDALEREPTSEAISSLTGQMLPAARSATWRREARLALLQHALSLQPTSAGEIDYLAEMLAAAYVGESEFLHDASVGAGLPREPFGGLTRLVDSWKSHASPLLVARPVPDDLAGIERRHGTRLRLADGPIERSVATQVTALELIAYVVAAEQPIQFDDVRTILDECARRRRDASHVLEQAVWTELARTRLWIKRLRVPDSGDDEPEGSAP